MGPSSREDNNPSSVRSESQYRELPIFYPTPAPGRRVDQGAEGELSKSGHSASLRPLFGPLGVNERFYEKVIKVKADVAALLNNLFSDVSLDVRG
jgi:hypothetical protein